VEELVLTLLEVVLLSLFQTGRIADLALELFLAGKKIV